MEGGICAFDDYQHRIYADDYANVYAIVDQEDYWYFSQWRWEPVYNSTGRKIYLKRTGSENGLKRSMYLHVEIHSRRGIIQPTENHTMVDHINCDSLYCRRYNLRWATPSMNRRNRFGQRVFGL